MQFWKELEGKTVAGRYALGTLLRFTDRSAWFATRDDRQKRWTISLTESLNDDDQLLKDLEAASRVKHANVVCIEKTGRTRVEETPVVYALLEPTEENLGEILKERPLTPEETAQITESLVAGLTAIHEQGLFHGQVNPANILASGDTVKLSSDCLQRPSAEARADAQAQDTGDLGATVFQALTQRTLTSPDDPAIKKLPVPFRSIVQSAVSGRWGLADIAAALKKPALEEIRHPIPNVQAAVKPKFAEDTKPKAAQAAPARKKAGARPAAPEFQASTGESKSGAVRVLTVIALLAAIGVVWFFYRSRTIPAPDATHSTTADTTTATTPAEPSPAPATPAATTALTAQPPANDAKAPTGDHRIWRVVIYTFTNQSAAQHKVAILTQAHPEWKPELFSAKGHSPWLVTVGGPMDRERAYQMRGAVKAQGMPGDSYAQNYSH